MTKPFKKKLIEVALPLEVINAASARDKSIRHGHPSTLHLWWARRPLSACRAILFAQLVDDPSGYVDELVDNEKTRVAAQLELDRRLAKRAEDRDAGKTIPAEEKPLTIEDVAIELERQRLFDIIEELVLWENSTNLEVLARARAEILRCCGGELPAVYDPFSGGGTIPLEAQRLGLPARGSDLNPVAVLIGKAMIELPPAFKDQPPIHPNSKGQLSYRGAEGLAEDILFYAGKMREIAWAKIGHLYPLVRLSEHDGGGTAGVLAWLWARTVASPNPAVRGAHVPLISSFWLCKKDQRPAWVKPRVEGNKITFEVHRGAPSPEELDGVSEGTKSGRGANFVCLLTGDAITADYVKAEGMAGRMGWKLMAIVAEGSKGRAYVSPTDEQQETAFSELPTWRPDFPLSRHPQYMSVTNYGPRNVSDLFMDRQTIALNTFFDAIPEVLKHFKGSEEYRKALATYLAMGVSRLANRQSTSTFWDNGAEKIQQVFAMQALPMRWDTAEGNPFSTSSGNFIGQVEYLAKSVAALPAWNEKGLVVQKNAQAVDFTGYVISTDPPYYDNVPYADLSDFFYVWLRKGLAREYPDLFETVLVPKAEELVADHKRHNGKDAADTFFLRGMTEVMQHMAQQGRPDIPAAIYYAFRQGEVEEGGVSSKGWATFLQAVISAGYQVGATWPVRTELVGNLKKNKNVLATSVVLSCRPRDSQAETVSRSEFIRALKRELPQAMREMQRANIAPVDMPQASIGPGIGIFSRYNAVLESDDTPMTAKAALQIINQQLDEYLSEQEGEFDPDTRFAVTWYSQHGFEGGNFGDADNLARARGISVDSAKHAGIIESAAGRVRVLRREELLEDWDPSSDPHLTIWECCQHLIRLLENKGEYEAAVLIKKIGPDKAEAVKELAYMLFDICGNKRKDAKEASSYNALIAVWAELTRRAATISDFDVGGDRQAALNL